VIFTLLFLVDHSISSQVVILNVPCPIPIEKPEVETYISEVTKT